MIASKRNEMPAICRFFGIIITMYYDDHDPAHFHASYERYRCSIAIEDLHIMSGNLPARAMRMVKEWAAIHKDELLRNWEKAKNHHELCKIEPLE